MAAHDGVVRALVEQDAEAELLAQAHAVEGVQDARRRAVLRRRDPDQRAGRDGAERREAEHAEQDGALEAVPGRGEAHRVSRPS
jgi:hypothetical protein